jgi:type IV pilus assembly protein PilA
MRNRKGFTLIELMIVVAIIGILAAIAIPNFLKFQAKSKQSEAKTNLKGIYTAETGYFGENNRYSTFDNVNWAPVGNSRYHFTLDGNLTGADALNKGTDVTGTATWGTTPAVNDNNFTAGAAGNIDNDPDLDTWIINDNNILTNSNNDV